MATITSLICFGGKGTTKTVTFGASNLVTLTNHGLRNGTGVQFSGGTLPTQNGGPTALAENTTYYAKYIDANTFELYTEAALTNKILFNNNDSGTIYIKSAYYAGLADKSRWTYGGVEYIFDSLNNWEIHRSGTVPASKLDTEVCEIGMGWTDFNNGPITVNPLSAAIRIEAKVNGVYTSAYHNGVFPLATLTLTSGYELLGGGSGGGIAGLSENITLDGFIISGAGFSSYGFQASGLGSIANRMIFNGGGTAGIGMVLAGPAIVAKNCIAKGWGYGFLCNDYLSGLAVINCLAVGNVRGFGNNAGTGAARGRFYNNISIGNSTANWAAYSPGDVYTSHATNNAGLSGEAWITSGESRVTMATTNFTNYDGNVFTPAAITSPQVETGVLHYGFLTDDITGAIRPSYSGSAYNTAVTAGSFILGLSYTIAVPGTTDFTLIGAANSNANTTFKANGVGTGTGTATLNAKVDIGPYEYNLGYGSWPNSQETTLSGYASGSRIKIAEQSGGAEIYNTDSPTWPVETTYPIGTDTPIYIYVRKGSSAPFYKPLKLSATIDDVVGLTYDMTGLQIEDIARGASYTAGVATDWTFNSGTGAITHSAGTTRYTVQDLYSWHADYYDGSAEVDDNPLINGITPTQFELINTGDISDADLEDLKGGSVEFEDGTLWSNLWTTDTMAEAHDVYVVQGTSKYTAFWSAGPLDVLLKVSNAGTLVSSGLVTAYARPWGYTYANYTADLSAGGRNVAPLSTLADAAITETAVTVGGWTDVVVTFGTYSLDFGDGDGAQGYKCRIDCNGRPLSEVYQRMQYLTRDVSTATLNGVEGWRYAAAHSSYTANNSAPFGTYSGGVWSLAKGVWLDNVPSGDALNYIVTDDSGGTHQNVVALNQSVTITGPTAGSRVQIYDTTNNVELFNSTSGPYYWEDPLSPVGDRAIRVRISYVSGTTAKTFIEQNIGTCGTAANNKDVTYLASQTADSTYDSNAIDGSTVTGITFTDAATDLVNCNIAGGTVSWGTIYAAFVYWNFTSTGIANDFTYISAPDPANYLLSGMKVKNTSSPSVPLTITGGYGKDSTSGSVSDIMDTTAGSIFPAPDHVVNNIVTVGGVNIITGDIDDVAGRVLTAAQSTPIYAEIIKVAGETVAGSGTEIDPWRPS